MKTTPAATTPVATPAITEADVREYAYHLYCQGGCAPGHDQDNWLEAEACLRCNVPQSLSHLRLHHAQEAKNAGKPAPTVAKAA